MFRLIFAIVIATCVTSSMPLARERVKPRMAEMGCGSFVVGQVVSGPGRALDGSNLWLANRDFQIFAVRAVDQITTYQIAARANLDRVVSGKEVTCRVVNCRMPGPQPVAICRAGDVDIGEALLRAGSVVTERTELFSESEIDQAFVEKYLSAEFDARDAKRGYWSDVP